MTRYLLTLNPEGTVGPHSVTSKIFNVNWLDSVGCFSLETVVYVNV
jgi:hypothetical protein